MPEPLDTAALADTLERVAATVAARRHADPKDSYVAALLAKGLPHVARKLGEEAVETVVAALASDPRALTAEAADLIFHLIVLLEKRGVAFADVLAELERREGTSGHDEKASRPTDAPAPAPVAETPPPPPEPLVLTEPVLAPGTAPVPRKRIRKG